MGCFSSESSILHKKDRVFSKQSASYYFKNLLALVQGWLRSHVTRGKQVYSSPGHLAVVRLVHLWKTMENHQTARFLFASFLESLPFDKAKAMTS